MDKTNNLALINTNNLALNDTNTLSSSLFLAWFFSCIILYYFILVCLQSMRTHLSTSSSNTIRDNTEIFAGKYRKYRKYRFILVFYECFTFSWYPHLIPCTCYLLSHAHVWQNEDTYCTSTTTFVVLFLLVETELGNIS